MLTRSALSARIVSITALTMIGARELLPLVAEPFLQARKALQHRLHLPPRAFAFGDRQVLVAAEEGEDAARFGNQRDAQARDAVRLQAADLPALVADRARARR